jgi:3-methyladenine DNA glycosylase AlkD
LGVRLPDLRKIAKQIVKSDWRNYLRTARDDSFEEILLQGLVIGYVRVPVEEYLQLIATFIPKIDNWAICDTFCSTIKLKPKDRAIVWEFLQPYFRDNRPFALRFALVMLFKFIDAIYIANIFEIISEIRFDNRYVKLASAWLVGECCVHFHKETIDFLGSKLLDPQTQNIAIRKITESFRISSDVKIQARKYKY